MTDRPAAPHARVPGGEDLVKIEGLKVHFPVDRGPRWTRSRPVLRAVDGVDLVIRSGETVGLVGESGCGKSTLGRAILQLNRPTAGSVQFQGIDLGRLSSTEMRRMRRRMQMILQDPYASLDPRMTANDIVGEALEIHDIGRGSARVERVSKLLELVGLSPALGRRYPHEFSGGQRQRIGVARALAVDPEFIVADEPISALDVSIQAQLVNLLEELQDELGLTYLFIAHDLAVVAHIANRVGVMYLGVIVELADRAQLYAQPLHPYTQALLSAVPIPDPEIERSRKRIVLTGDIASPVDPPSGCRFRTRCFLRERLGDPEVCSSVHPPLTEHRPGHWIACHFAEASAANVDDVVGI